MNELSQKSVPEISAEFPNLAGKVAIVTGASRGIGQGIATFLGRQRMQLVLTGRTEEAGQAFTQQLSDKGIEALWVTADLAVAEHAERVFTATLERFGSIDLLVNNAAHMHSAPFLKLDRETFTASFENNVRIVYHLSPRAARFMADKQSGVIINISSVGGLRSHRGLAGYDASKGALDALTRSMSLDLAPHGIRVNAVAPGATLSGTIDLSKADFRKRQAAGIPLGRLGRSEEMGAAVAFLASDAGAYITGQVLYVDGGLTTQLTPPGIFI